MSPLPSATAEFFDFPVVCLCGSAGALPAYREILQELHTDTGMVFIVVSHRGMDHTDLIQPLLSRNTSMSVMEIQHGMRLEPNRVLLSPPHQRMSTDGFSLHLHHESNSTGWPVLITSFLLSLAELGGARAVVVVLSGLGYDGSPALGAVKAGGGYVMAQSGPAYDSMPRHAIETGHVDQVLSPVEIGRRLSGLTREIPFGRSPQLVYNG